MAPHCGAFLGGTFTPGTSINSPVAMNHGKRGRQEEEERRRSERKRRTRRHSQSVGRSIRRKTIHRQTETGERELFNKLAAYELPFAYLLFESFGRQSCATPSTSQREDSLTIPTVIRSTENKIHSPPPHEEPSFKQREDSRLNILPPL